MEDTNLFGEKLVNGVPTDTIENLFTFWKETFNKRANTVLDETRSKKLAAAIKAYGEQTCKEAILGCSLSQWHNGKNPNNKTYNDITLIFRNADKVEMFTKIFEDETKGNNDMNEWINS